MDWSLGDLTDYDAHPWMEPIMRYIEPKIIRGTFLPCWEWGGRYQVTKAGTPYERHYPTVNINAVPLDHSSELITHYVHRFMAETFWEIPPGHVVYRLCENERCVNPNHMSVSYRNDPDPGRNPLLAKS